MSAVCIDSSYVADDTVFCCDHNHGRVDTNSIEKLFKKLKKNVKLQDAV